MVDDEDKDLMVDNKIHMVIILIIILIILILLILN